MIWHSILYEIHYAIWYQPLFDTFMVVRMHPNACWRLFLPSCCFYELAWHSNGSIKCQTLNAIQRVYSSNLLTFEWCFLISKIMKIAIQCYPSQYYVMYFWTNSFTVKCNVFISLLWLLFSDAAGNQHNQLVEIPL